jgi:hypothetical protein
MAGAVYNTLTNTILCSIITDVCSANRHDSILNFITFHFINTFISLGHRSYIPMIKLRKIQIKMRKSSFLYLLYSINCVLNVLFLFSLFDKIEDNQ